MRCIKKESPDTPSISEDVETDKAVDIINKVYGATSQTAEQNKTANQET